MASNRLPGRDSILQNLKAHARIRRAEIGPGQMAKAMRRETDRGAVIMAGALVEDVLLEKIEQSFRPLTGKENKELLGPDGPIGTFSNRIRLAYALKIIDKDALKACELLKAMRNAPTAEPSYHLRTTLYFTRCSSFWSPLVSSIRT